MWLTRLLGLTLLACSARCLLKDCKSLEELPKGSGSGSGSGDRKVVCSNMELQQVPAVGTLPNRTVILILSNNKIQELKNGSFLGLTSLERLDIRNNGLSRIEPGAFLGLKALKRLDLSNNRISCLNAHVFTGLTSLARLYLSGNVFSSVPQETFEGLVSLKTLEFQTPYLLCDCHLRWMPRWLKAQSVTVKETRCSFPQTLLGQQVAALRPEALTCDAPLELPAFQMTPSQRQIVFRGDSLPFRCLASYVDQDMQVLWLQDGRMVQPNASMGIFIQKSTVHNCSLIASALTISNIQPGSTGTWECVIQTSRGNNTRTVPIVVLESSAKYCPPERISNNKGEFRWPRTMAGLTVHLPCHRLASGAGLYSGVSVEERRAWRRCEPSGAWLDGDYSRCQYQKDVTRVLFIINQMPLNLTNAVTTARQLLAYTVEAANFSDKMDVIFVAQMIEKFGKFAEKYKELGDVMVDIASNLMLADERVLWMAQREARACSRIVECLQRIVSHRLAAGSQAYSTTSTNIALEAHAIRASSFSGMTCTLLQKLSPERAAPREFSNRDADSGPERHLTFKCNVSSTLSSTPLKNAVVEASLQLPASLFSLSDSPGLHDEPVYKLHLLAFRNGKLFPSTGNSSLQADNGKRRSVATPVILAKIDGLPVKNLRWPVNATLRRHVHGSDPVAAYWNFSVLGGQGGWQSQGCRVLGADDNFTTVSCDSLNNYAVLLDPSGLERASSGSDLLHPVLYTTAVVLELCVLLIVGTYAIHHRSIRISRKCWHMLLNLHLHIFLTCGVFIGGINQTRYASVCQAIGIVLHYSTLATLLWVGVTARNIYKQLTRKAKRYEELDEGPPAPRPMLRFYLIGGGIPTIVCGITAAANIRNYGSRTGAPYCWMAWEPSLGAFYGPASFVTLVDCVYFLCIAVQLRRHPERRYELKDPPEEDDDDEEQQQQRLTCSEHGRSHDPDSVCQGDLLENEQTFVAQLVGAGVALLLFVALWASAALAVSRPPPLDLLFSCLCGTAALALGGFALVHHCAGRQDVRRCWAAYACPRRDCAVPLDSAHTGPASTHGDVPKCPNSSAESSCAPSVKNSSSQGCKLTNLQVEAAQCKPLPLPAPNNELAAAAAIPLDNSLTEHSLDNEIKMHVAPLEVPYRVNGTAPRPHHHHRPRSRAHRSSRLTVLREYAHDLPTSVEGGSVQSGTSRNRHEARASSRRHTAYLAHRGRLQSLQRQDSSDAGSSTLPRRTARLHNGTGKECVKQQISVELESHITKSYGVNLASPGGTVKENGALLGGEGNGSVKTGLWKHETTV